MERPGVEGEAFGDFPPQVFAGGEVGAAFSMALHASRLIDDQDIVVLEEKEFAKVGKTGFFHGGGARMRFGILFSGGRRGILCVRRAHDDAIAIRKTIVRASLPAINADIALTQGLIGPGKRQIGKKRPQDAIDTLARIVRAGLENMFAKTHRRLVTTIGGAGGRGQGTESRYCLTKLVFS